MNRTKWEKCKSVSRLVIKLHEEAGEIAKAYLDAVEASDGDVRERCKAQMLVEIDHLHHIASCLDDLISGSPAGALSPSPEDDKEES